MELATAEEITAAVPGMDDEQLPSGGQCHRESRSHPGQLWVVGCFLDEASISLLQSITQVLENALLVGLLEIGKVMQQTQGVGLHGLDGQCTGDLAGVMAIHSIGNHKQVGV